MDLNRAHSSFRRCGVAPAGFAVPAPAPSRRASSVKLWVSGTRRLRHCRPIARFCTAACTVSLPRLGRSSCTWAAVTMPLTVHVQFTGRCLRPSGAEAPGPPTLRHRDSASESESKARHCHSDITVIPFQRTSRTIYLQLSSSHTGDTVYSTNEAPLA